MATESSCPFSIPCIRNTCSTDSKASLCIISSLRLYGSSKANEFHENFSTNAHVHVVVPVIWLPFPHGNERQKGNGTVVSFERAFPQRIQTATRRRRRISDLWTCLCYVNNFYFQFSGQCGVLKFSLAAHFQNSMADMERLFSEMPRNEFRKVHYRRIRVTRIYERR